jgi:DNA-binding IclR family transcriptional regulator
MHEQSTAGDAGTTSTRTVDRALRLLITLLEGSTGGTLTELSRSTALSPSTASRLLGTMAAHHLVRRDETGRYRAGIRMMQLAATTLREDPLYDLVGGHLTALAEETGETALLGVASSADQVLYLRQASSPRQEVQTADWTGRTIPREDTALGAALSGTPSPRGYLTSLRPGSDVIAVAVPLIGHSGQIVAAISINAPVYRTAQTDIERFGHALMRHATAISAALGAPAHQAGR